MWHESERIDKALELYQEPLDLSNTENWHWSYRETLLDTIATSSIRQTLRLQLKRVLSFFPANNPAVFFSCLAGNIHKFTNAWSLPTCYPPQPTQQLEVFLCVYINSSPSDYIYQQTNQVKVYVFLKSTPFLTHTHVHLLLYWNDLHILIKILTPIDLCTLSHSYI